MAKGRKETLFRGLTRLFRSGPVIKRKVRAADPAIAKNASTALDLFNKSQSHVFTNAINAYGQYDRMSRYHDFSEMEQTPEISTALDVWSDEAIATDENGQALHIYSNNPQIRKLLTELFYDTLNIEFNIRPWVRNLLKYGDGWLFIDVSPDYGVINVIPVAVNEIEREEGFDSEDPMAVRFRWITQGNQILENWQVAHFRLLGNDAFLPYGSSILEAARRTWRQLILIEDAMLVYRVVRSPERRVFYIDVGSVPPADIPAYMEKAKATLRSNQIVDKQTGRVDLRNNPTTVLDDYFIPVRGGESGTKIDTLPGGTHLTAIEDVQYIQKKLFSALKVPRAYLGYDEMLSSKATLAQEDIRFSRSIQMIQRVIIAELNKIATIHLYANGFDGEQLLDFALRLSNPSTIAQQQKLELYRTKFEIAAATPEGLVDRYFLRKHILGMTDEEIKHVEEGIERDKLVDNKNEAVASEGTGGAGGLGDLGDLGGGEPELGGGGEEAGGGEDLFASQDYGDENELMELDEPDDLLVDEDDEDDEEDSDEDDEDDGKDTSRTPIKPNNVSSIDRELQNRSRRRTHGASKLHMPDFGRMTGIATPGAKDVYDKRVMGIGNNPLRAPFGKGFAYESVDKSRDVETVAVESVPETRIDSATLSALRRMHNAFLERSDSYRSRKLDVDAITGRSRALLTESDDRDDWVDVDETEDNDT